MVGTTSLPITINVEISPASAVTVDLTVETNHASEDIDDADGVNSADLVTIDPSSVTFSPWEESKTFTIILDSAWDTTVSSRFYVNLALSGTDATAF